MKKSAAALGLALVSLTLAAPAYAECSPAQAQARFPALAQSVENWQSSRKTRMSPTVKERLFAEYCEAATRVQSDKGGDEATISAGIEGDIYAYLDRMADAKRPGRSLDAIIYTRLGSAGFALPSVKSFGVIKIVYNNAVDQLRVGGHLLSPWQRLMVLPGSITLVGLNKGSEVCLGQVQVDPAREAEFVC